MQLVPEEVDAPLKVDGGGGWRGFHESDKGVVDSRGQGIDWLLILPQWRPHPRSRDISHAARLREHQTLIKTPGGIHRLKGPAIFTREV